MRVERYVALGDSQTEGLHDYGEDGAPRGWADRLAEKLSEANPDLLYANLAVRGRLAAQIRAEQLQPALGLDPDLVTVVAGVNDIVRPGSDMDRTAEEIESMYGEARRAGCIVMGCTFRAPPSVLSRFAEPRIRRLNALLRSAAARHGVILVEFEDVPQAADRRLWCPDRIHLNPHGHTLLAHAFAATLAGRDRSVWMEPLPPEPGPTLLRQALDEAAWLARFVAPKLIRLLRGRSTGDGRTAKRPDLRPVQPAQSLAADSDSMSRA